MEQLFWKLWTKRQSLIADEVNYTVCITVYIWILGEFARHVFTNLWLETIWQTLCFSLFGEIRLSQQNRSTNKQDKWINGLLITCRTMEDYRNSPTIKWFHADFIPCSQIWCPSLKDYYALATIDQTFIFLRLTFRQIKWTVCKKRKRNSDKLQLLIINIFLWFRINYSRNWECIDQCKAV